MPGDTVTVASSKESLDPAVATPRTVIVADFIAPLTIVGTGCSKRKYVAMLLALGPWT